MKIIVDTDNMYPGNIDFPDMLAWVSMQTRGERGGTGEITREVMAAFFRERILDYQAILGFLPAPSDWLTIGHVPQPKGRRIPVYMEIVSRTINAFTVDEECEVSFTVQISLNPDHGALDLKEALLMAAGRRKATLSS